MKIGRACGAGAAALSLVLPAAAALAQGAASYPNRPIALVVPYTLIKADLPRWAKVVAEAKISAD